MTKLQLTKEKDMDIDKMVDTLTFNPMENVFGGVWVTKEQAEHIIAALRILEKLEVKDMEYLRPDPALLDELQRLFWNVWVPEMMLYGDTPEFKEWYAAETGKLVNKYK
jgi:hypothetical protein